MLTLKLLYLHFSLSQLTSFISLYPDPLLSVENFAQVLCEDLELPTSSFAPAIIQSIKQQVENFTTDVIPQDEEDRRVIIKVSLLLLPGT